MIGNAIAGFLGTGVAVSASSYESIQTTTVGSGGAASISFSSIPATYTHLQVRGIVRDNRANSGNGSYADLTFNNNSSSNSYHQLYGNGTSALSAGYSGLSAIEFTRIADGGATSGVFSAFTMDILDYANTNKYKTIRTLAGYDNNGSGAIYLWSGLWTATNAITTITITDSGGTLFSQYSKFALYGIKG